MKNRFKEKMDELLSRMKGEAQVETAEPLFTAGGKPYASEKQLTATRMHESEDIFKDCYGRMVLRIDERYPIFDSYDALYENRYFHNYYIKTGEDFVYVRTADDQPEIKVIDGVTAEYIAYEHAFWHSELLEAAGIKVEE